MNDTAVVDALLRVPVVQELVGDALALLQRPPGGGLPALVYQLTTTPRPYLEGSAGAVPHLIRLQLNPLADSTVGVEQIHAAIAQALAWQGAREAAGHWVTHIEPGPFAGWSKDEATGAWTRPRDYLITYEE